MKCPLCEKGDAVLSYQRKKRIFRKEEFELFEYFYKCNKCKEEFTTTEIDTLNTNQVYNKYREKYSIPFPSQLTSLREHYSLSAAKMSELLGFGANQYRLYESGELPAGGNATVLTLILNPGSFKELISKSKSLLSDKKFEEIIKKLDSKINERLDKLIERSIFPYDIIPNRFTGFSVPDFNKFTNMVLYFVASAPFKVRLNKLLFYADFANYKYTGYSISGCKYAAIDMGSVPDQFSILFGLLESEKYLRTELVRIKDKEYEKFISLKEFKSGLFFKSELRTLDEVHKKFQSISTTDLMKISHSEKAWLDNIASKALIDYSIYAPQLIGM
jgi:transcriptional regulator with XRE-family HTH domain